MAYVLPRPLPLRPDESLASLIVRNSEMFRFRDPMRLLRRIGKPPALDAAALATAHMPDSYRECLRELLGLSQAEFDRVAYGRPDGVAIFGHPVHSDLLLVRKRRWCPACLREHGYHRAVWDCSLVTACPEHGFLLASRCPACGRGQGWTRASQLRKCWNPRCQGDLGQAEEVPAGAGAALVAEEVHALLKSSEGEPREGGFDVGDTLRLAFSLGIVAAGFRRMPRPHEFCQKSPDAMTDIVRLGFRTLEDWPSGFEALLSKLREGAAQRQGHFSIQKHFGTLLPRLIDNAVGEPFWTKLAEAFNAYAARQPDLATRAADIVRIRTEHGIADRYVTLNAAAVTLNTSKERMRAAAARHGLFVVAPMGSGTASLLDPDRFASFRTAVEDQMDTKAAHGMLGISKKQFIEIERKALVPTIPPSERLLRDKRYRKSDVAGFLEKLEGKVKPSRAAVARLLDIASLAQQGKTTADLLEAVLSGALVPVALDRSAVGIKRLLFDVPSVARTFGGPGRGFSIKEAAVELGTNEEAARFWAKRGLLRTERRTGRLAKGDRVMPDAVAEFKETYSMGTEFCEKPGTRSAKWGSRKLLHYGATPVSGPTVDGCVRYLFARADAEEAHRRCLEAERRPQTRGRAAAKRETVLLAERVGTFAAAHLGLDAVKRWNRWHDAATDTTLHVLVARRTGKTGAFYFSLHGRSRHHLEAAENGWIAFGFIGSETILLVPWLEVRNHFATPAWPRWLPVVLDGAGRADPFGKHALVMA